MISILDIERAFRLAYLRFGDKLGVGVQAIPLETDAAIDGSVNTQHP
jgi:hypothetical protein